MIHAVLEGDRGVDEAERQVLGEPVPQQRDQLALAQGAGRKRDHVDPATILQAIDRVAREQVRQTLMRSPIDDGVDEAHHRAIRYRTDASLLGSWATVSESAFIPNSSASAFAAAASSCARTRSPGRPRSSSM